MFGGSRSDFSDCSFDMVVWKGSELNHATSEERGQHSSEDVVSREVIDVELLGLPFGKPGDGICKVKTGAC